MIITRWMAPIRPTPQQIKTLLELEGLEPFEERFEPKQKISDHRHPFTEVRVLLQGEMLFNVAGNQVLLREGDRIEVPANTKHSHICQSEESCHCLCAQKII
ncbi:MAG: cupin domain-containing protein [Bdellovibrio sp.]|nr:MAG: cupin domain-containing protein [Bdellovibrio sp.]